MSFADPWGKFDEPSGARHHLAHHCADVAAAFHSLAAMPVLRSRMEQAVRGALSPVEIERLAVLVFLHDIGKLFPSFQAKCWPAGSWSGRYSGHVLEALDVLCLLPDRSDADALRVDRVAEWVGDTGLFNAVLAHHGRPVTADAGDRRDQVRTLWRKTGSYDPSASVREIGQVLTEWFPSAFAEADCVLRSTPDFEHLFAGLTALADWIGSSRPASRFVPSLDHDYMDVAKRDAAARLASIGLDVVAQRAAIAGPPSFATVTDRQRPNAQQNLVGTTGLEARVVVLEAETGSGKTEAALWRYAQLFEAGHVDGLYFAVPTRAAAKQLHGRIDAVAKRLFGEADPQAILAVPGYLLAGDTTGKALPSWRVRWDDAGDADEARLQARWAAEDSKKYMAAQIAVGTVDQAMLAALLVKHAHVRAAALSRSLLVIDEVHASDRYMSVSAGDKIPH